MLEKNSIFQNLTCKAPNQGQNKKLKNKAYQLKFPSRGKH